MPLGSKLQILAAALATSAIVSTPASAGLLDFLGGLLGGGGSGGGAPEIDASAGFAAMAFVACVAAIAYRKNKG